MPGKIVALVPIRGGSQGLPGKNIYNLGGKLLFKYAVEQALAAGVSEVFISTDISLVLEMDLPPNVQAIRRPTELCQNTTPMAEVVADFAQRLDKDDTVVLLQATSPLREPADIQACLDLYSNSDNDLILSSKLVESSTLKMGTLVDGRLQAVRETSDLFSNRQDLPAVYHPNGAVFVFGATWFLENGGFVTERIGIHVMSDVSSMDIDTKDDLDRVLIELENRKPR